MADSIPSDNAPPDRNDGHQAREHAPRTAMAWTAAAAGSIPTLLVLLALGAIAYWGHATGWKAPKFSEIFGPHAEQEEEDWCVEHAVPESKCIKCHPELAGETAADWCKEHGVPESRCTICHPEILTKGVAGDWCREHGVPESNCTLCHPEIAVLGSPPPGTSEVTVSAELEGKDAAGTGGSRRAAKDPATCQTHALRVQFASAASVEKAGVRLGSVVQRTMADTLRANAEIEYDRTKLAQVSSRVSGVAWWGAKEVGEKVRAGDVLAIVDSADIGRAKAELLEAAAQRLVRAQTYERTRGLNEKDISPLAELQEHEAALRQSQIRLFNARQVLINYGFGMALEDPLDIPDENKLRLLGVPPDIRDKIDVANATANLLPIASPLEGVVIERNIVAGEAVEPLKPIFVVADTRRMWVMFDVPQAHAGRLAIGQRVRFAAEGPPDDPAEGSVSWISTAVDDQTRTVKARAVLDNPDGRLLAGMFGQAAITIRNSPSAIVVPDEAVQWDGCCNLVFVRLSDEIFQPRKIRVGARSGGYTEVLVGVLPGEVVATTGSHVLKSEILKSNLGAGCTCQ